MNDILTYQELEHQIALLKKENEILHLKSSFSNEEGGNCADKSLISITPLKDKEVRKCTKKQSLNSGIPSKADTLRINHEFQVHQLELEMRNEELQWAKEKERLIAEKYTNLYDFSPSGYFTLDHEFSICELNFSAAKMLGKERSQLIDCNFILFITSDKRIAFINFLDQISKTKSKKSCEVQMCINENPTIFVHVEGAFSEIDKKIILTVVDVSDRNQADAELDKTKEYLQNTIDGLMESVVLLDKDGVILFTNRAWQEFADENGVAMEMSSIGTNYLAACKTDEGAWLVDAGNFAEKFEKMISGEIKNFSIEYSCHLQNEERWFVCNASKYETNGSSYFVIAHENSSKRKKAEQALEKSEKQSRKNNELLRSIMESPKGIIIFSLDSHYRYTAFTVSHQETMKHIWGVDIKVGVNMLTVLSKDAERKKAKQNFDLALSGEHTILIEEYGTDDLDQTWWENRYSPIYSDTNTIVGLTVFVTDISECKRLENSLLENQHRFEKSQALGHVGNWEYSIETELFWVSDESKRIYGFDLNSNNFTLEDIERCIPERERVRQALIDLIADDKNYDLEFEIIPADKTIRKIIHSIAELERDLSNKPLRVRGIILDVTNSKKTEQALKESEELFRLLADNSSDMIARHDLDGNFLYASPACRTILGYEPEELIGTSPYSYFHPEDLKKIKESHKCILDDKITSMVVYRFRCKNGKYIWFETCSHRIIDKETGVGIEIHSSNRDVSERVEAQKQIKFQNDSLQEHIASKDKFFSIIAHDLRGPLGSMAALSELLVKSDKKYDAQTQFSFIESIATSSQNTYKLLENLLEWSRLQTGNISFVPEEGLFNEVVSESISQIQVNATVKNIKIINNVVDDITSCFDRVMMNTVLRNFISNSIKFTPQLGTISVDAKKQKGNVIVSIQDTGVGMCQEDLNKLFRITEKYSTPGTENEKGSGLGLILCKEFIEMHGGEIGVESELGKGTVFKFTLPLNRSL